MGCLLDFFPYDARFRAALATELVQWRMDAARYQIFGRVQGVGYRYFAQRTGQELRLRGWVKNLPDGSVAVAAMGQENELRQFEQCLRTGPPAAQVTRIEVHPWQPEPKETAALQGFLIASE